MGLSNWGPILWCIPNLLSVNGKLQWSINAFGIPHCQTTLSICIVYIYIFIYIYIYTCYVYKYIYIYICIYIHDISTYIVKERVTIECHRYLLHMRIPIDTFCIPSWNLWPQVSVKPLLNHCSCRVFNLRGGRCLWAYD